MNLLRISDFAGQNILSGKEPGKELLPKLIAQAPDAPGEIIAVDFASIDVVTASFFREAFRAFRDYARNSLQCAVVFTNASDATIEEAKILALQMSDVFVFANLADGHLSSGRVVGHLEEKQALTLKLVTTLGEADARKVREHSGDSTGQSVWNNRLAALLAKGILVERAEGRSKIYRPLIKELAFGL
jgi:uncharacterized protein DUF4325